MKNSENKLRDLRKYYTKKQLFDAVLTDLVFFLLMALPTIILFVNIVFMVVRFFTTMYVVLYGLLVIYTFISKKFFFETLDNYKDVLSLDKTQLKYILVMIYSIVILFIQFLIFTLIT